MKACWPTRGWRPQWRAAPGLRLGWQRPPRWLLLACCATPVPAQDYGPWRSLGPFEHSGGGTAVANAHAPDKLVGSWVAGSPGPDLAQAFKGQQGLELHWQLLPVAGDPRALDVGALDLKADRLMSEIWPAMIIATMLFMCLEMLLATSKALLPAKPKPKAQVRVEKKEEVAA